LKIKLKKLREDAVMPIRGSKHAAGADLYACPEEQIIIIPPNETVKIPTGIAIETPRGYFGAIVARSGLATNFGLRPANCIGVLDEDYRGEVIVALHNDSKADREIRKGDRIAQLVMMPYLPIEFVEADELSETVRGEGGFGSTGK